jgi:hypothetical protein
MTKRRFHLGLGRARLLLSVVLGLVALQPSCSSDSPVSSIGQSTLKLSEQFKKMGETLGQNIAALKSSATSPLSLTPAGLGAVAIIASGVTGGTDIGGEQKGKSGDKTADVVGVGYAEAVSIFVPDPPAGGTGTSASLPSFLAWKGDDDSYDKGLCYLAWPKGQSWFVVSKCGNPNGAYVCQVPLGGDPVCNACNTAGQCNPCDMEQTSFTCAWP